MVYHDYKVGDIVMIYNHAAYKYENPYRGQFLITHCWTNNTVTLQFVATKLRYNIRLIKPYTFDTNVEDIHLKTNY